MQRVVLQPSSVRGGQARVMLQAPSVVHPKSAGIIR